MILSPTVGGSQEHIQDDTKRKGTSGSEPACWPEFAQILSDLRVDRDTGEQGWALQPGCLGALPGHHSRRTTREGGLLCITCFYTLCGQLPAPRSRAELSAFGEV